MNGLMDALITVWLSAWIGHEMDGLKDGQVDRWTQAGLKSTQRWMNKKVSE